MEPYIYLLFGVIFFLLCHNFFKIGLIGPFLIIALFSGFRKDVGIDFPTYLLLYEWGAEGTKVTAEPLFSNYLQMINYFGGNAQMFFLFSALLTNLFVYLFIQKISTDKVLSFLIYFCVVSFYLYTFNAVRQWLACSVFLFSLTLFKERKFLLYAIVNTVAALTFHMSLFLIFPLTFVTLFNLGNRIRIYGYLTAISLGLASKYLLSNSIYGEYTNLEFDSTIDIKVYFFFLISIILEINRKKYQDESKWSNIMININYLSILILIVLILQSSGTMILLFKRIHNYYFSVFIVFIPFILGKWRTVSGLDKVAKFSLYILLPILFVMTLISSGEYIELIPYKLNFSVFK